MHIFICKTVRGIIVPVQFNKKKLLSDLLNSYENLDKKYKVTIELVEKNINENQKTLYNAYIVKSSNYFGNTFEEMENILKRYWPLNSFHSKDYKSLDRWSSQDLNDFISKSTALLSKHGFKF